MQLARGIRTMWAGALLMAAALGAGCGSAPGTTPPAGGVLTLDVAPQPVSVDSLALTSANVSIEGLTVIGDVTPGANSTLPDFGLDVLGATRSFTFDMLPQGVYSRVSFRIDEIHAQGTWRGVPLSIQLESEDGSPATVDLRSSSGVELAAGHDATLTVDVDAGSWFAGDVLDSATQTSSQITIDSSNNAALAGELLSRAVASFALGTAPVQ